MRIAVLVVVLAACSQRTEPSPSEALARPVAEWKLTRDEWVKVVVDPYRAVYDDYARAFDGAVPALQTTIATWREQRRTADSPSPLVITRQHYANDPELTRGQARARWALPVQAPAQVVVLDDAPIDAVFVRIGDAYKAIVGVDQIVLDHTRALDAACAPLLETLGSKACQTIGWEIADAALRSDEKRLAHACSLARSQCAR